MYGGVLSLIEMQNESSDQIYALVSDRSAQLGKKLAR